MPRETPTIFQTLAMAGLGGFSDAVSFSLFGTFTGHITGGTVLAAIRLVAREAYPFWCQATAVAVFVAGTAFGALLTCGKLRAALGMESLFFLIAYFLLRDRAPGASFGWARLAVIALASAAMGIQNGSLQNVRNVSVHTTFLTGITTHWVTEQLHRSPDEAEGRALLGAIMVFFFLGAALGALCASRMHEQAFVVMAAAAGTIGWAG